MHYSWILLLSQLNKTSQRWRKLVGPAAKRPKKRAELFVLPETQIPNLTWWDGSKLLPCLQQPPSWYFFCSFSFSFQLFFAMARSWARLQLAPRALFAAGFCLILVSLYLFSSTSSPNWSFRHRQDTQVSYNVSDEPVRACFVVLVRNEELNGIASTIRQVEERFNKKFNYPYIFLNDNTFTPEFINVTSALTSAETRYGKLDEQMWGYPSFINQQYAAEKRAELAQMGIPYADSESYRHMCRFACRRSIALNRIELR